MKHLLLTTIAAVVLVGCATTRSPEPPTAKAPDLSILDAAEQGDIEAVKQHLADGADVNAKDRGWTPLLKAAWHGHKEITELLIAEGADVNAKGNSPRFGRAVNGETPLDWAIRGKHTEAANLLRKHGGKTAEELKAEGK
jgi:ankyrin repeat protein